MFPLVLAGLETGHLNRAEAVGKLHVRRATLDMALRAVPNGGTVQVALAEIGLDF
jgi:hypothetical protein